MKILEFSTQQEAQDCLNVINTMAMNWWISQGYTVLDNDGVYQLVGKNASTGKDEPTKTKTLSWDTIKESPDNTFYFASLTGTCEEWENWKQNLADSGFTAIGEEKEFPSSWITEEDIHL